MTWASSRRFIPAAVFFLLSCVAVLSLAATSTLIPLAGNDHPEVRTEILTSFLH